MPLVESEPTYIQTGLDTSASLLIIYHLPIKASGYTLMSFASLTTGIRFNKKTNSKTQALFQQPATASADLTGDVDDFFQAAEPSRKRRKLDDQPFDAETTDADAFRKLYRIKTSGTDVPAPVASFLDLESLQSLPEDVKSNLRTLEFKTPTPIQSQAVPIMLQVSAVCTTSNVYLTSMRRTEIC